MADSARIQRTPSTTFVSKPLLHFDPKRVGILRQVVVYLVQINHRFVSGAPMEKFDEDILMYLGAWVLYHR